MIHIDILLSFYERDGVDRVYVHSEYNTGWLQPVSLLRALPSLPARQDLGVFVSCGGIALRALPLGKCPLYTRRGINKQRDVRRRDLIPSMVGTGSPVALNCFV